jgi:predicted helicase
MTLNEYIQSLNTRLFTVNSVGIVTARDNFTIHESKQKVRQTVDTFLSLDDEIARRRFKLGKDVRDWKICFAKKDIIQSGNTDKNIVPITYRPFDSRFTYFTGQSKGFHCMPRGKVMKHMLGGINIALSFNRQIEQKREFADIFVFNELIQHHSLSIKEVNYLAPLYLYPDDNSERIPNLNPEEIKAFEKALKLSFAVEKKAEKAAQPAKTSEPNSFAPIDILDYIYAVLHSPSYREK